MAMKHLCIFVLFICLASCAPKDDDADDDGNDIVACGVRQPQKNLPWLKAWIEKAETDQTGHYWGVIWLVKYKEKDLFVTNMMLGSGGIANWYFDCSGNHFIPKGGEDSNRVSEYVEGGYVFFEDEKELFSYVSTLHFNDKDNGLPVIYSTF
jgi:hypothetical protein